MANRAKKSQAKKPARKKTAPAQAGQPHVRAEVAPKPALVLANAVKPDERLSEAEADALAQTIEKSWDAAGQSVAAVNRKLVDIAQTNLNAGLALARDLAGAKTPMEAMWLGMSYCHERIGVFECQAQALRTLSAEMIATTNEPIRAHLRRS